MNANDALVESEKNTVDHVEKEYRSISESISNAMSVGRTEISIIRPPNIINFERLKSEGYVWYKTKSAFFMPSFSMYTLSWAKEVEKTSWIKRIINKFKNH